MPLAEWEYMPCVGPRPPAGLVGLKNAGATCYMNSVLQQLYCVRAVRDALLTVQGLHALNLSRLSATNSQGSDALRRKLFSQVLLQTPMKISLAKAIITALSKIILKYVLNLILHVV